MEWRDWTTEPVVHDHITSAAGVVARNAAARFIESSEVILGIQGYVPLERPLESDLLGVVERARWSELSRRRAVPIGLSA
jgi:hypothetical protein